MVKIMFREVETLYLEVSDKQENELLKLLENNGYTFDYNKDEKELKILSEEYDYIVTILEDREIEY
jgi:hypothetical protein